MGRGIATLHPSMSFIILAWVLFLAISTWAATSDDTIKPSFPDSIAELEAFIVEHMKENSIPGVAAAMVSRDSMLWIGTFGVADLETGALVTENTHFRIGSCTKTFTGLAFLKLVETGKLDLYMPVREIAPEIEIDNPWEDTDPVRVVHLLEHTAGFEDSHINWFYFDGPPLGLRQALKAKNSLRKSRWRPGTRFSYSSPDYTLAGYVLEKVTGEPYADYVERAILRPIGMTTSTIGRAHDSQQLLSKGYGLTQKSVPYYYDYDEPAGAMNSSIREMVLFVQFMLNRGRVGDHQFIDSSWFDLVGQSTTTLAAEAGLKGGYGFGIGTRLQNSQAWYAHGGLVPGFNVEYAYNMDCGLGYVVMINRFGRFIYSDIIDEVERYLGCDFRREPPPATVLSENRLRAFCGYYEPRSPRMQLGAFMDVIMGGVTIVVENDTLYEKGMDIGKRQLIPVMDNSFRLSHHPRASRVFVKMSDGTMVYTTTGYYYERTAAWKPVAYRILFFGTLSIMCSALAYALFWIPVHVFKWITKRDTRSKYLWMRIVPLAAVASLVLGILFAANQDLLQFGTFTFKNVIFFLSTLVFAAFSVISLYTTWRSFHKPVHVVARIYTVVLSVSCSGMTFYLAYWGIIGLRTWAY